MHYSVPQFDAFLNVLISEDSFSSDVRAQIEAEHEKNKNYGESDRARK